MARTGWRWCEAAAGSAVGLTLLAGAVRTFPEEGPSGIGASIGDVLSTLSAGHSAGISWTDVVQEPSVRAVAALLAFGLFVRVTVLVAALGSAARVAALCASAVAAIAAVALIDDAVPHAIEAQSKWVALTVLLALGAVLARLLLLVQLLHVPVVTDRRALLASQEAASASLNDLIDRSDGGDMIQLEGRWGEGKSFLLTEFCADHAKPPVEWLHRRRGARSAKDVAIVRLDIWKYESEHALHRAMVKEILSHPAILLPWGWLQLPLSMLLPASIGIGKFTFGFGALGTNVGAEFDPPRLYWQRHLERAVDRLRRRNVRLVLILDEVDRASSATCQAAFTLTRRSLDVLGVTIVLSYVEDVVLQKAFNPLIDQIDDLRTSSLATLAGLAARDANGLVRPPWWPEGSKDAVRLDLAEGTSPGPGRPRELLEVGLANWFLAQSPAEQRRIQRLLASKFVASYRIRMEAPDVRDIKSMMQWKRIEQLAVEILGTTPTDALLDKMVDAVSQIATGRPLPPLRTIRANLHDVLSDQRATRVLANGAGSNAGTAGLSAETLLVFLVLVAFDEAAIREFGGIERP